MLIRGALPEKEIAHLGAQLAAGLVAAHDQRVVHCDLKPRNLRVTTDGRLKILDFGIASCSSPAIESVASDSTPDSSSGRLGAAGTLPWMSPDRYGTSPSMPEVISMPPARRSTRWRLVKGHSEKRHDPV